MVAIGRRLSFFIIMIMFTLLEARDQGKVDTKVAPRSYVHGGRFNTPNIAKTAFVNEVEGNDKKAKGRKMGSTKDTFEAKVKAKVSATDNGNGILEKSSGATSTPCKMEKLNVICNHNVRISSTSTPPTKAKKADDFVAISADYKDPKSHPPRHN